MDPHEDEDDLMWWIRLAIDPPTLAGGPIANDPTAYVRRFTPPGAEEALQRLREDLKLTDDQTLEIDWSPLLRR